MLESPNTPTDPTTGDNNGGRTWTLAAAALFIAAILIGAIIAYAWPSNDSDDGGRAAPTPAAPTRDDTDRAPENNGFGTPRVDGAGRPVQVPSNPSGQVLAQVGGPAYTDRDPAWLTGAPKGLMWQAIYAGAVAPFSTSDGPSSLSNGVPKGFSRTPQGAVLAAFQITTRLGVETDTARRKALIDQVTVSDGSEAAAKGIDALKDATNAMTDLSAAGANVLKNIPIAVKVNEYDGNYALISYGVTTAPAPMQAGIAGVRGDLQVVWRDGQWKVPFPLLNSYNLATSFAGWSTQW